MKKNIWLIILSFFVIGCTTPRALVIKSQPAIKITGYGICDSDNKNCVNSNLINEKSKDVFCFIKYSAAAYRGEIYIIFSGPGLLAGSDDSWDISDGEERGAALLIEKDFPIGPYMISIISVKSENTLAFVTFIK